jgi:hypothetical protein
MQAWEKGDRWGCITTAGKEYKKYVENKYIEKRIHKEGHIL